MFNDVILLIANVEMAGSTDSGATHVGRLLEMPSHFILCPFQGWGKLSIISFTVTLQITRQLGHIRPFCALATRLVREREPIIVTFIVAPPLLDKTRTEISRQFLDDDGPSSSGSSNNNALQRIR